MNEIIDLLSNYKGEIERTEKGIEFTSVNAIYDHWGKEHHILCTIEVRYVNNAYTIFSNEKTYEILGGDGMGGLTKDGALKRIRMLLTHYNFKKKEYSETSLF